VRDEPRLKAPLALALVLVLQTVVAAHLRVRGVAPDLMLLVAVAAAVTEGPEEAAVVGFVVGLATDLLFLETPLGLSALVFSIVAFAAATIQGSVLRTSWWMPFLTVLLASAAGEALFAMVGSIVGLHLVTVRLVRITVVVAAVNVVLTPLATRFVRWSLAGRALPRAYA
jgi:rod shape-determining protein MreD